jgi:hypothetical protein
MKLAAAAVVMVRTIREGNHLGQMTQKVVMVEKQEKKMPPHLWAAVYLRICLR